MRYLAPEILDSAFVELQVHRKRERERERGEGEGVEGEKGWERRC